MAYKLLADLLILLHLLWILFLILGGPIGRPLAGILHIRYRWVRAVHISALLLALSLIPFGIICPLTHLELWARSAYETLGSTSGGPSGSYEGSFIIHYIEELIYLNISTKELFLLTVLLCSVNGLWYLREYLKKRYKRR